MVDRLHPGAGVNSFLRDNTILQSIDAGGKTIPIDQVATVPSLTTDRTVPVTVNDVIDHIEQAEEQKEQYTCPCQKEQSTKEKIKETIEHFCDEQWHGVSMSVIFVIVVIALSIAILAFTGQIKICSSCCDKQCEKKPVGPALTGGDIF